MICSPGVEYIDVGFSAVGYFIPMFGSSPKAHGRKNSEYNKFYTFNFVLFLSVNDHVIDEVRSFRYPERIAEETTVAV